jgi:RimJ/RimL family protein N-acetyltransferase
MQKLGMKHEGRAREHAKRWDRFEDLESYGILKEEWERTAVVR